MAFVLSACGLHWVNRSNPYANYEQDGYACKNEALRLIPDVRLQPQLQQAPSYNTNCTRYGNNVNCQSTAIPTTDLTGFNQTIQNSRTSADRSSHVSSCMRAKGWYLTKKPT